MRALGVFVKLAGDFDKYPKLFVKNLKILGKDWQLIVIDRENLDSIASLLASTQ